ncbi:S41 family peptidase [uncultured Chitinophaga sp.]|uniref:S41 family peptidase n=1 Tax=uncultured Chitinophaga sp. TaxID=339340 RepID=UPI00260D182A|nr:S41 family peptidase [uncultured Chitinophaga sp.]
MKKILLLLLTSLLTATFTDAQTRQQIDNLYTFARLYGYVRYFHPSDAAVVTDWDKLAIYGAQRAEQATNPAALQQVLEEIFHPIAPSLRIYPTGKAIPFKLSDITPADTSGMKPVSWQHDGYGLSGSFSYRSVRANGYTKQPTQGAGFSLSYIENAIDVKPYQGMNIRFSAAMKALELADGTGELWLQIERTDNSMGRVDRTASHPATGINTAWQRDTIAKQVDRNGDTLRFGCLITNKGSLLIDDIKVEVQTAGGWQTIKGSEGDFEADTADAAPAHWHFNTADKYFVVKTSRLQSSNGKQALYMEKKSTAGVMIETAPIFDTLLPPGTLIKKDIGNGLSIIMPVSLWGDGEKTYPLTDTTQINVRNEMMAAKLPASLSGDDLYVRLADIIIAWNVIQHFHPYNAAWTTDWDADLHEGLSNCYKDRTASDFLVTLSTMLAKLRDGHGVVAYPGTQHYAYIPVKWEWVEQRAVITHVLDPNIPLQRGDVVTAINGVAATDYIKKISRTVCGGAFNTLMIKTLSVIAQGPKDSSLLLSVQSTGKSVRQVKLPFSLSAADYSKVDPAKKAYEQIDSGIVYVNLSLLPWKELQPQLPALSKANAVIFDLRGYPRDANGVKILSHLVKQRDSSKWMHSSEITLPDHENRFGVSGGWRVSTDTPHIGGKVIFLTDGNAISYAESVMGYVKGQHLGTIVGENTAGANGNIVTVRLPGRYSFVFTGLKVTNHDGSQHYMKGVQPDITVHKTIRGIREGRDEQLAKAIEICK